MDKFIGDGILAYVGYKTELGNGDPYNAIRAALKFRSEFPRLKEQLDIYLKRITEDETNISLKCGMENGQAYLHYYSRRRNSVILLGSAVNFASRLEGFAEKNEIITSEKLKNMILEKFSSTKISVTDRQPDGIKGFEDQKFVYAIDGELDKDKENLGEIVKVPGEVS